MNIGHLPFLLPFSRWTQKIWARALPAGLALGAATAAHAAPEIRGFTTVGYSRVVLSEQGSSQGVVDKRGTFLRDSRLGLNISGKINKQFTYFSQLTASGSEFFTGQESDYGVNADMLFLSYRPFEWWELKLGKQISPLWMMSEEIDVGLTYLWIRPPAEVYRIAPLKSITGFNTEWKYIGDSSTAAVGVQGGEAVFSLPGLKRVDIKRAYLGYFLFDWDEALKIRGSVGGATGNITSSNDTVLVIPKGTVNNPVDVTLGVQSPVSADITLLFMSGGVQYDSKYVYVATEVAKEIGTRKKHRDASNKLLPYMFDAKDTNTGAYGTLGLHIFRFTPHVTYGIYNHEYSFAESDLPFVKALGLQSWKKQRRSATTGGLNFQANSTTVFKGEWQFLQALEDAPSFNSGGDTLNENERMHIFSFAVSSIF